MKMMVRIVNKMIKKTKMKKINKESQNCKRKKPRGRKTRRERIQMKPFDISY